MALASVKFAFYFVLLVLSPLTQAGCGISALDTDAAAQSSTWRMPGQAKSRCPRGWDDGPQTITTAGTNRADRTGLTDRLTSRIDSGVIEVVSETVTYAISKIAIDGNPHDIRHGRHTNKEKTLPVCIARIIRQIDDRNITEPANYTVSKMQFDLCTQLILRTIIIPKMC